MPLATVPIRINEVDKNQTIYVVCRSGARSMQAAQWLDTQGYEAVNIEGGTDAWAESGFEIKTGD
jgi:rhodanese-related sulfurtransferase